MLNENIRALRKARGFSQEELALKLNVVRQTVSKWEKGLSVPDAGMLIQIAEALEVPVNALLGEQPTATTEQEALRSIAAKLELLNEQYAKRNERSRKIWRWIFIVIGALAICVIAREVLTLVYGFQANQALKNSEGVIGGIDASTPIYVSHFASQALTLLPALMAAVVSIAGICFTRRK